MTKKQFEDMFREEVLPYVIERERGGFPDKPARREAWNNTVDAYIRDGALSESAGNWGHPRWLETWGLKRGSAHDYEHATKRRHAHATKKSPTQLDREINESLAGSGTPPRHLKCDMAGTCSSPITHVDEKGFIYCSPHGINRRAYNRCRKLTASEKKKLERGETIAY